MKIFTSTQYRLVVQSLMNTCGSQVNFFEFDYRRMEVDCKLEYHIVRVDYTGKGFDSRFARLILWENV